MINLFFMISLVEDTLFLVILKSGLLFLLEVVNEVPMVNVFHIFNPSRAKALFVTLRAKGGQKFPPSRPYKHNM